MHFVYWAPEERAKIRHMVFTRSIGIYFNFTLSASEQINEIQSGWLRLTLRNARPERSPYISPPPGKMLISFEFGGPSLPLFLHFKSLSTFSIH